ncbi:MAG: hypothetical protein R6X16_07465 [Anaerolineae bacterium]
MNTTALLNSASDVLAYEWEMLRGCSDWLFAHQKCRGLLVYRATAEAWLLHCRQLIEFFYGSYDEARFPGDIRLVWWFQPDSDEYNHFRKSPERNMLVSHKQRIDQHLAHLTAYRVRERLEWDTDIQEQIDRLMRDFVCLAASRIGTRLTGQAAAQRPVDSNLTISTKGGQSEVEDISS